MPDQRSLPLAGEDDLNFAPILPFIIPFQSIVNVVTGPITSASGILAAPRGFIR
jgi:hypothetical protein